MPSIMVIQQDEQALQTSTTLLNKKPWKLKTTIKLDFRPQQKTTMICPANKTAVVARASAWSIFCS